MTIQNALPFLDPAGGATRGAEILFGIEELFFSRTDEAGLIQFGNDVFQRVSVYSWDELLNRPHKIVRNPDTPRAVFWLLWNAIKQGSPIGAYVKNRTKDGRYYWVFAIVTPVAGGYLSVRLRPTSDILPVVKTAYPALAEAERRENLAPADSAGRLLKTIASLGYDEYETFMASALAAEVSARDAKLGRRDQTIARFDDLIASAKHLLAQADLIAEAYTRNQHVPLNFRVLAAQLGSRGAAIGIISSNFSLLSAEMSTMLEQFITAGRQVFKTINNALFLVCTARLQREVLELFRKQADASSHSGAREIELLDHQQREYTKKAVRALEDINHRADEFHQSCMKMDRLAGGLEVTRIMGRVECANHQDVRDRTDELLNDLQEFQKTVVGALVEIDRKNRSLQRNAGGLLFEPA